MPPSRFLSKHPFDLYELHIIHEVARCGSLTQAGRAFGLSQSAVTRQIQGVEQRLGADLFERTTRHVRLTPAGRAFLEGAHRIIGEVDALLDRVEISETPAVRGVRLGLSNTVALAYLPGFLFANRRRRPDVKLTVAHASGIELIERLEAHELDVAVLSSLTCAAAGMKTLRIARTFEDRFVLVAPDTTVPGEPIQSARALKRWAEQQTWLLISAETSTGRLVREWMAGRSWGIEAAMELESFDLIIHLVAQGLGVSLAPIRALALYGGKRGLRRIVLRPKLVRELAIVTRRERKLPKHVEDFVENILF